MSSERVWEKTHLLGGRIFKLSALISVLGIFSENYAVLFVSVPILLGVTYLFFYSYLEYQREKRNPDSI